MDEFLQKNSGRKIILGNEAIVRGALESGVNFVSTYPGTPSSEIGNIFYKIAKDAGVYFEFSTNEKVALEASIGASFSGLKTLVAMKNFGLNVALDALFPFVYTGSKGPTVIIVADDTANASFCTARSTPWLPFQKSVPSHQGVARPARDAYRLAKYATSPLPGLAASAAAMAFAASSYFPCRANEIPRLTLASYIA